MEDGTMEEMGLGTYMKLKFLQYIFKIKILWMVSLISNSHTIQHVRLC